MTHGLLDWLILGGGVHGTHLSHALVSTRRWSADRVRVLDPHTEPLAAFWRVTAATGMRYLRSPGVHHLDLSPHSLIQYGKRGPGRSLARFVHPYERPGLALFRAHCEHVVRAFGLDALRVTGRALALTRREGGYRVETERGALDARRVVLAIGLGEQPVVPAWAEPFRRDARVQHLFDANFNRDSFARDAPVVIVGGGISAAQLACHLAREDVPVMVVARHAPRVHRFDSDPQWLGPKGLGGFSRLRDPDARRAVIREARHRGSMPPEVASQVNAHVHARRVRWIEADVTALTTDAHALHLTLDRAPSSLSAARLVLATGFDPRRPGGAMLDDAVERLGLRCAACGYPLVSPGLEWAPGLFVSGPLAELELGPVARNIAGARAAGQKLRAVA
jgi:thioredoxin reductase